MKKFNLLLVILSVLLILAACGKDSSRDTNADAGTVPQTDQSVSGDASDNNSNTPSVDDNNPDPNGGNSTQDPPVPPAPDTPLPTGNMNPLTGLYDGISDEALSTKPVAIMVGNSYGGMPQWGIGQADIIYEMIAEARMTRLMAIFQDWTKIDRIAAIRSARPYFMDIAQSYGAAFVHYGGSETSVEQIAKRDDLIDIDGIKWPLEELYFPRDPERKKNIGSEHSVYTTGEFLDIVIKDQPKSIEQTDHPSAFIFSDTSSACGGTDMRKVQLTFKNTHMPYFIYDEQTKEYLRFQYKEEHIDGLTGKQLSFKNLLVLRMELHDLDHYLDIVDITTTGEGTGYYFCEGKYIEIIWKKESYNSPINYFTKNGEQLVCEPGKTFVSVVTTSAAVDIE